MLCLIIFIYFALACLFCFSGFCYFTCSFLLLLALLNYLCFFCSVLFIFVWVALLFLSCFVLLSLALSLSFLLLLFLCSFCPADYSWQLNVVEADHKTGRDCAVSFALRFALQPNVLRLHRFAFGCTATPSRLHRFAVARRWRVCDSPLAKPYCRNAVALWPDGWAVMAFAASRLGEGGLT